MVFISPADARSYKQIKAQMEKTYGVKIRFTISKFPKYWRDHYTVKYKPVPRKARRQALLNLKKDLKKYRLSTIRHFLQTIYIFRKLRFGKVYAAGTYKIHKNRRASLFLEDVQLGNKYGVFHHEFSSLILARYPSNLRKLWVKHNPKGFEYAMEGVDGPEVVRNGNADLKGSAKFWQQGFVVGYGTMDFENDFNTFFETYMAKREKLNRLAKKYPRIKEKMKLVAQYFKMAEDHVEMKELKKAANRSQ